MCVLNFPVALGLSGTIHFNIRLSLGSIERDLPMELSHEVLYRAVSAVPATIRTQEQWVTPRGVLYYASFSYLCKKEKPRFVNGLEPEVFSICNEFGLKYCCCPETFRRDFWARISLLSSFSRRGNESSNGFLKFRWVVSIRSRFWRQIARFTS